MMFSLEFSVCVCADFSNIYTDGEFQSEQFEDWQDVSVDYNYMHVQCVHVLV